MDNSPPTFSVTNEWPFVCFQQTIVMILAGMVLDNGYVFQSCAYAFVAFWSGVAVLSFRRKKPYTRVDIRLFRYGSIPLCIMSLFLTRWIWHLRGY